MIGKLIFILVLVAIIYLAYNFLQLNSDEKSEVYNKVIVPKQVQGSSEEGKQGGEEQQQQSGESKPEQEPQANLTSSGLLGFTYLRNNGMKRFNNLRKSLLYGFIGRKDPDDSENKHKKDILNSRIGVQGSFGDKVTKAEDKVNLDGLNKGFTKSFETKNKEDIKPEKLKVNANKLILKPSELSTGSDRSKDMIENNETQEVSPNIQHLIEGKSFVKNNKKKSLGSKNKNKLEGLNASPKREIKTLNSSLPNESEPEKVLGGEKKTKKPKSILGNKNQTTEPESATSTVSSNTEPEKVLGGEKNPKKPKSILGNKNQQAEPENVTSTVNSNTEPKKVLGGVKKNHQPKNILGNKNQTTELESSTTEPVLSNKKMHKSKNILNSKNQKTEPENVTSTVNSNTEPKLEVDSVKEGNNIPEQDKPAQIKSTTQNQPVSLDNKFDLDIKPAPLEDVLGKNDPKFIKTNGPSKHHEKRRRNKSLLKSNNFKHHKKTKNESNKLKDKNMNLNDLLASSNKI